MCLSNLCVFFYQFCPTMAPFEPFPNFDYWMIFSMGVQSSTLVLLDGCFINIDMHNNSLIKNASIVPNLRGKHMFQVCTCARVLSFRIVGNGLVAIDCLTNCPMCKKSKKKEWKINHMFQDVWATKAYWVEIIMGLKGTIM